MGYIFLLYLVIGSVLLGIEVVLNGCVFVGCWGFELRYLVDKFRGFLG